MFVTCNTSLFWRAQAARCSRKMPKKWQRQKTNSVLQVRLLIKATCTCPGTDIVGHTPLLRSLVAQPSVRLPDIFTPSYRCVTRMIPAFFRNALCCADDVVVDTSVFAGLDLEDLGDLDAEISDDD